MRKEHIDRYHIDKQIKAVLPDDKVDWKKVESDLSQLPKVDKKRILQLFDEKWAPSKIAEYMVDTVMNSNKQ